MGTEAVGAGGSISWSHLGHEKAGGSGSGSGGGICRRGRGSGGGAIRCGREHTQGCKTRAKERTNLEGSPLSSLPSSSSSSKTTTLTIPTPSPGLKMDVVCGGVTTLLLTEPAIGHAKNQTLATPEKRSRALFSPLLQPLPPPKSSFFPKQRQRPPPPPLRAPPEKGCGSHHMQPRYEREEVVSSPCSRNWVQFS